MSNSNLFCVGQPSFHSASSFHRKSIKNEIGCSALNEIPNESNGHMHLNENARCNTNFSGIEQLHHE